MKKKYIKPDFTIRTISLRRIIMTSKPKANSVTAPGISTSSNTRGFYDDDEYDEDF